jgi:hypothetical protein
MSPIRNYNAIQSVGGSAVGKSTLSPIRNKIISLTLFLFTEAFLLFDHKVFVNKDIKLNTPSSIIVHPRTDAWDYNDHRERAIRMFNGNHYRIICENGLIIYHNNSPTKTSYNDGE